MTQKKSELTTEQKVKRLERQIAKLKSERDADKETIERLRRMLGNRVFRSSHPQIWA